MRYSLLHPQSYIRANVECYVTLLEEIRRYKDRGGPWGASGDGDAARAYAAPQLVCVFVASRARARPSRGKG